MMKSRPLISLMLVFILPIVAAKLLYNFRDHFDLHLKNHGNLITPPIPINTLQFASHLESKSGQWQFIYLRPPQGGLECDQHRDLLQRIKISLGKNQSKVTIFEIEHDSQNPWTENSVLIVDPKGFLMMSYPSLTMTSARGILQDIRRLLRFSND